MRSRALGRWGALAVATLLGTGCVPLPIPHSALVAPAVQGRIEREDGSPVAGRVVATSNAWGQTCRATSAPTTTDGDGTFTLAQYHERRAIYWFTLMESFGRMSYSVCLGAADDSLAHRETIVTGLERGDELMCLEWWFEDHPRLTCGSELSPAYLRGGAWHQGDRGGDLRFIQQHEFGDVLTTLGYLQWVGHDPVSGLDRVYATIPVTTLQRTALWDRPVFVERQGRWFLEGEEPGRGWPHRPKVTRLEIGGPGELWLQTGPSPL